MNFHQATLEKTQDWMRRLAQQYLVFFPFREGLHNFSFEEVGPESFLDFDHYQPTITPPGKKLLPEKDDLVTFELKEDGTHDAKVFLDTRDRILAGVRPCDVKAIDLMDQVFMSGTADPHYLTRRKHTTVIAVDCLSPCNDECFCDSVGSLTYRQGADIWITPLGEEQFLFEPLTEQGEALLGASQFPICDNGPAARQAACDTRPNPFGRQFDLAPEKLPGNLADHIHSPVWEKHTKNCFSCGTCNLVCPTCYCFEVCDQLDLTGKTGTRTRSWDSCMIHTFSEVSGGHNFRASAVARQRHRVRRKFDYLPANMDKDCFCVGCGRCGHQCTANIDIFDIVNDLCAEVMEV